MAPAKPAKTTGKSDKSWSSMRSQTETNNAANDSYGDLVKDGVIDPVKVTRSALANELLLQRLYLAILCNRF